MHPAHDLAPRRALPCLPSLLLLGACGPATISSDGETGETGEGFDDGRTLVMDIELGRRAPRVDLLLVIDDSPSMRGFTALAAANFPAFADVIEDGDVRADIRIAITTTSVPGPTCAGPLARGGEPLLDSCRAHLEDFVGPDEHGELGGGVEDLAQLCMDQCSLDAIPLVPSLGGDEHLLDDLALRPWIEAPHNPFGGNLDGVELREALSCAALRGFGGCMFESPLEAAARMVERMADPADPMAAFRRPEAALMIVTIGDEDDCSHPEASATIFDPAGDRSFWPDPNAAAPVSAICIAAGLRCDARDCTLTDHALDGSETNEPGSAVLTPSSRLHDALVAAGEYDEPEFEPIVTNIGGYANDGTVHYTPPGPGLSPDEQLYLDGFGVLPGCQAPQPDPAPLPRAGPGGRVAAAATPGAQYSICNSDWSAVLGPFAYHGGPQVAPSCMDFSCIEDLDPVTELLEPDCVVERVDWDGARTELPTCVREQDAWLVDDQTNDYALPEGADACWVWLSDMSGLSDDPNDDMSDFCVDAELPAELRITRRPGASPLPYDSNYELRCRPCAG